MGRTRRVDQQLNVESIRLGRPRSLSVQNIAFGHAFQFIEAWKVWYVCIVVLENALLELLAMQSQSSQLLCGIKREQDLTIYDGLALILSALLWCCSIHFDFLALTSCLRPEHSNIFDRCSNPFEF